MLESLVEWMNYPLYYAYDGTVGRAGASRATIYPYGLFPAGDGKTVLLGLQNEREWAAFCGSCCGGPGALRGALLQQFPAQCRAGQVAGSSSRLSRP